MNRGIRLIPAIFGLIGIVLLVICGISIKKNSDFLKKPHQATAVITSVYERYDSSDGSTSKDVFVSYIAGNMEYSERTNFTTSGMKKGDTLKIY